MKKNFNLNFVVLLIVFIIFSCNSKNEEQSSNYFIDYSFDREQLITNKILYDVPIVNDELIDKTRSNPDWFWENIPNPDNSLFFENLLEQAISGKQKIYYYVPDGDYESFTQIPDSKQKHFMDSILSFSYQTMDSELSTVDNIVFKQENQRIGAGNIKKVRFLEEWYIKDNVFKKRVIAVAPFFFIDIEGQEPLKKIFFWILLNENEQ